MSSDTQWVAGLRAGDTRAYEAVFRAYHARLCTFAHSYLQNRADAEEVVQELFLALWQKQESLSIDISLRAYLFRAIRNRVLNRSARARLEQRWLDEAAAQPVAESDPAPPADQVLQSTQLIERVQTALRDLPPGCQRVLQLRWQEELSYAEIAETLGISVKGVENQLSRARRALRLNLGGLLD